MKKIQKFSMVIFTFICTILLTNITYAGSNEINNDKYQLSDESFTLFLEIQKINIELDNSKVLPCDGILKKGIKKLLGKQSKSYIYNKIDYSQNSAIKNQINRIDNTNYKDDIKLPNLYLGFTTNEKLLCNEKLTKKVGYYAIEAAGKKVLEKASEKLISAIDYSSKIYDIINSEKVVNNTFINAVGGLITSTPERTNYTLAGGNYYQSMYLSNIINGLNTYKNIDIKDKKQVNDLNMRNKLYSLYNCYLNSQDKKQMNNCLKDFSSSVIKDKSIKTNLKSSDITKILNKKDQ